MSNAITLLLLFLVLFSAFFVFDQIIRLEYKMYRRNWDEDGRPHGFFWIPKESKGLGGWVVKGGSTLARNRLALRYLFSTPEWVRQDKNAKRLLLWLRILVFTWNAGILIVAAITFLRKMF